MSFQKQPVYSHVDSPVREDRDKINLPDTFLRWVGDINFGETQGELNVLFTLKHMRTYYQDSEFIETVGVYYSKENEFEIICEPNFDFYDDDDVIELNDYDLKVLYIL